MSAAHNRSHIDRSPVEERHNSMCVLTMELRLFCTNLSIYSTYLRQQWLRSFFRLLLVCCVSLFSPNTITMMIITMTMPWILILGPGCLCVPCGCFFPITTVSMTFPWTLILRPRCLCVPCGCFFPVTTVSLTFPWTLILGPRCLCVPSGCFFLITVTMMFLWTLVLGPRCPCSPWGCFFLIIFSTTFFSYDCQVFMLLWCFFQSLSFGVFSILRTLL